jgi:hypothetical protein
MPIRFSSLIGTLKSGVLRVNDRARKIEGELGDWQATAHPLPGGTLVSQSDLKISYPSQTTK